MVFSTKSLISVFVLVVLVASAVTFSGVDLSGDFTKKSVPWWCIKNPVYHPPQGTSSEYTPPVSRSNSNKDTSLVPGGYNFGTYTPGFQSRGSFRQPDLTAKVENPIENMKGSIKNKFGKIESGGSSASETSGGSSRWGSSGDTIFKGKKPGGTPGVGNIPGISVSGEYPPSQSGDGDVTPKDGYWNWQLVCPDGYTPQYELLQQCPRIKNFLEKGIYTEATLPPELKKILPLCKQANSWFKVPKQSPDDCDALFMKSYVYGWNKLTGEEASKLTYCQNMQPNQSDKTWNKFKNICVDAKKTGKKLSPDMEKACKDGFIWWNQLVTQNECKDLFKLTSDYLAFGGNACELPIGDKAYACMDVYPELDAKASTALAGCYKQG